MMALLNDFQMVQTPFDAKLFDLSTIIWQIIPRPRKFFLPLIIGHFQKKIQKRFQGSIIPNENIV